MTTVKSELEALADTIEAQAAEIAELKAKLISADTLYTRTNNVAADLIAKSDSRAEAAEAKLTAVTKERDALNLECVHIDDLRKESHAIVNRIWTIFGTPSYEALAGRSIYDLINGVISERDEARAKVQELESQVKLYAKIASDLAASGEAIEFPPLTP